MCYEDDEIVCDLRMAALEEGWHDWQFCSSRSLGIDGILDPQYEHLGKQRKSSTADCSEQVNIGIDLQEGEQTHGLHHQEQ